MFKKLTYTGTECNNSLCFSFYGEYFDVDRVTKKLKIKPSSVKIKKDPTPVETSWEYKINAGDDLDLEVHLEQLIDIFEPKIKKINKLKKKLKLETILQFVIDIDIDPDASTPFFGLNKRAIEFLSLTKTEVAFDLYKADTIGLLNNSRGE